MLRECRVMIDPPSGGAWNMAVDEALLVSAAAGVTTLRFYQWSEPTLSLGYFQPYDDRQLHAASQEAACVRRTTGGGAILHDRELTYSFATPAAERFSTSAEAYYAAFHETLMEVLAAQHSKARLCDPAQAPAAAIPPFLCFQRRTRWDVLLGEAKICGSAQRRHRGALLQHGSVVLATSPLAPEIPGIAEASHRLIEADGLASGWQAALAERLHLRLMAGPLSAEETNRAEVIRRDRFGSDHWLNRR